MTRRAPRGGFAVKPWMIALVVILAALIATLIVALSGPDLPAGR